MLAEKARKRRDLQKMWLHQKMEEPLQIVKVARLASVDIGYFVETRTLSRAQNSVPLPERTP